jgi:cytochrome c-type biogenesis protein
MEASPNLLLAFAAGVLSFVSPCCLPIYPSFLSYVTGVSISDMEQGQAETRRRVMVHSIAFIAGFSVIYVALGLGASALGSFFIYNRKWLSILGGAVVILMGLALLGLIRLPFLMRERRIRLAQRPEGIFGTVLIGITFAAGWTPCVGPILGAVLALAAVNPGQGGLLLFAYSLGFAIPFLLMAYAWGSLKGLTRYTGTFEKVGGAVMVLMGFLLMTGQMARLTAWLIEVTGFQGF